jgi:hypothetical protein
MSRRTSKLKQAPSVLRDINSAPAYFSDLALKLHTRGFEPVPLIAGSKACKVARWTSVTIDEAWITKMIRTHPRAGVGLRSKFTPGLDIDIDDGPVVAVMLAIVRRRFGEVLVRKGRGHRVLVPFRTDMPFSEINGMVFLRPGDQPLSDGRCEGHKIQVLADGQQFVGWAIHPDTDQPYEWLGGKTPLDVPHEHLPVLDEEGARALVAELETVVARGWVIAAELSERDDGSSGAQRQPLFQKIPFHRQLADLGMQILDSRRVRLRLNRSAAALEDIGCAVEQRLLPLMDHRRVNPEPDR